MSNIFTISKREVTRLRSRFTGRSRLFVFGIMVLAAILSYVIYHQEPVISKALYNIGESPGGPTIKDERFNVIRVGYETGYAMLERKDIDLYIRGTDVISRNDNRSQYAAGAIKQYLEKQELVRISNEYEIDDAFPLRIEIHHLKKETNDGKQTQDQTSLSEMLKPPGTPGESLPTPGPSSAMPEPSSPDVTGPASPAIQNHTISEPGPPASPAKPAESITDAAVRQQLKGFENDNGLPKFKAEFAPNEEVIVPSLMKPPIPLAQVLLAFFYVVPIFLVSVFFTSSFMEEKTNRKLVILMSAPITPFQIIIGKMLPYFGYSIAAVIAITLALRGNVLLGLAIFIPIMLFIFSIYLMVALLYRTFKDQTFFSMMAVWIVTAYLVAPAMFTGVNDLSYISPLTLAVLMYRGETFGLNQYLLSTIPMYLVFLVTMFVGTRIFNEEYLMGFRPLYRKLGEAISLIIQRNHLSISVFFLSLLLIPVAFMVQFGSIVIAFNLSTTAALGVVFTLSVITEEIAKSTGIVVLLQGKVITSTRSVIKLSFLSALGFLVGEKLLLFLALSVVSESMFTDAVFSSGWLPVPLAMHFIATCTVCLITARLGTKYYPLAILAGAAIHAAYDLFVIAGALS